MYPGDEALNHAFPVVAYIPTLDGWLLLAW
jgi:hypothetical protein